MRVESSVVVPASASQVSPHVADLDMYPAWMPLVHSVSPDGADSWEVELRAKVGPFARSKRIRMSRTRANEGMGYTFTRNEIDGRQHSPWVLTVDLLESAGSTTVTVVMQYEGSLWGGGVLDKVLASQIDAGKRGLISVVAQRA